MLSVAAAASLQSVSYHLFPLCSQLSQAEQEGPEERQRQTAASPAGQGGGQHRGERLRDSKLQRSQIISISGDLVL